MGWKDTHKRLLENKNDIIKQYKDFVPIKLMAREYGISTGCIDYNLKLWGIKREHGIKYLLGKMLLKGEYR